METILNMIIDPENIRMLVLLAFGFGAYALMKAQMKGLEYSLGKRMDGLDRKIDGVEHSLRAEIKEVENSLGRRIDHVEYSLRAEIKDLKANDFAHLNSAFHALLYTLEKNRLLDEGDKTYIGGKLVATVQA